MFGRFGNPATASLCLYEDIYSDKDYRDSVFLCASIANMRLYKRSSGDGVKQHESGFVQEGPCAATGGRVERAP
jgi:hypothetical protein